MFVMLSLHQASLAKQRNKQSGLTQLSVNGDSPSSEENKAFMNCTDVNFDLQTVSTMMI